MVNVMLQKILTIYVTNPSLATTDDKQYYSCPINMDIMKCIASKDITAPYREAHILYKEVMIVPLALYFNNDNATKTHCTITVNMITTNSIKFQPLPSVCDSF